MGNAVEGWKMKVKSRCPLCKGARYLGGDPHVPGSTCPKCEASGEVIKEIDPKDISSFDSRPAAKDYICVCGYKENILRPLPSQIPHGWLQWGDDLVCKGCKSAIILAASVAAQNKVTQLKEQKSRASN
jgi:hypothetical protein